MDRLLGRRAAVEFLVEGFESDRRGEVVLFPRRRTWAAGTALARLGAALPRHDALGFRASLYDAGGADRGDPIVALDRRSTRERRALFLGCRVRTRRTGAAWEELLVAESAPRAAEREGVGVVLDTGPA